MGPFLTWELRPSDHFLIGPGLGMHLFLMPCPCPSRTRPEGTSAFLIIFDLFPSAPTNQPTWGKKIFPKENKDSH